MRIQQTSYIPSVPSPGPTSSEGLHFPSCFVLSLKCFLLSFHSVALHLSTKACTHIQRTLMRGRAGNRDLEFDENSIYLYNIFCSSLSTTVSLQRPLVPRTVTLLSPRPFMLLPITPSLISVAHRCKHTWAWAAY